MNHLYKLPYDCKALELANKSKKVLLTFARSSSNLLECNLMHFLCFSCFLVLRWPNKFNSVKIIKKVIRNRFNSKIGAIDLDIGKKDLDEKCVLPPSLSAVMAEGNFN